MATAKTKKYNIQDLPVFFIEHAEDLSGKTAEEGSLAFITAVAFLVEHNYGNFTYEEGESEAKAYKRYRMERTSRQITELFVSEDEAGK